jgi:methionyl aminopeptidase
VLRRERIVLKSPDQIKAMRASGLVTAEALAQVKAAIRPGVTAKELDGLAEQVIRDNGGEPNFLGYNGYPASVCLSINDVVVHGIPGGQVIHEGDVVSVDCGTALRGWHSDAAFTVTVGEAAAVAECLNKVTEQALWAGIAAFGQAKRLFDVGQAIEGCVEQAEPSFGVLEDYLGHGIGRHMHMAPEVPNVAVRAKGPRIQPGMTVAIEPMVVAGGTDTVVEADGWTVRTVKGDPAAHWEHTVARTDTGVWVLTAPDGGQERLAELGAPFGPLE